VTAESARDALEPVVGDDTVPVTDGHNVYPARARPRAQFSFPKQVSPCAGNLHSLAALALMATVLSLPAWSAEGESYPVEILSVIDGDTVRVAHPGGEEIWVRLSGIDCPESDQPWGRRAREALEALVSGKTVRVEPQGTGRYGRVIGRILARGESVNRTLVEQGHCWAYERYAEDMRLLELHAEAERAQRGLWSLPEEERMPPWEWRRRR